MLYIRQVKVEAPGTHNQHIIEVKYSDTTTGGLSSASRASMVNYINSGHEVRTHNPSTGTQAQVVTRVSANNTRYITTVADERESNNLLELPRYI